LAKPRAQTELLAYWAPGFLPLLGKLTPVAYNLDHHSLAAYDSLFNTNKLTSLFLVLSRAKSLFILYSQQNYSKYLKILPLGILFRGNVELHTKDPDLFQSKSGQPEAALYH
jgi:hypothetical protein